MHLQSCQSGTLKKFANVSTICLKTLASDCGPSCSRLEQLKGKKFHLVRFLEDVKSHREEGECDTRSSTPWRHLLVTVRHQVRSLYIVNRHTSSWEVSEKRATDSPWAWKIWHVFYAVGNRESQKVSRWKISIFKWGTSKCIQGNNKHSW